MERNIVLRLTKTELTVILNHLQGHVTNDTANYALQKKLYELYTGLESSVVEKIDATFKYELDLLNYGDIRYVDVKEVKSENALRQYVYRVGKKLNRKFTVTKKHDYAFEIYRLE